MIGQTIAHYTMLEKLGEVPNFPTSVFQRVVGSLSIPARTTGLAPISVRSGGPPSPSDSTELVEVLSRGGGSLLPDGVL